MKFEKITDGMTKEEKISFLVILFFVLNSIFLAKVNLKYFESYYVERSGLLKQFQPMCMAVIAGLSFYRAWIFRKIKPFTFVIGSLVAAFAFCFALGETLTWGQRIFEFPTPEFFMKYNSQGMFTIHNLVFGNFRVNKVIFGLGLGIITVLYTIAGTGLYSLENKFSKLFNNWGVPLARWYHIIFLGICFGLSRFVFSGKRDEVVQFAAMSTFLLIFLNPLNKQNFQK